MIKYEILRDVVQSFSIKYMNVHHIHRLLYEKDEENCTLYENKLSFDKEK